MTLNRQTSRQLLSLKIVILIEYGVQHDLKQYIFCTCSDKIQWIKEQDPDISHTLDTYTSLIQ